MEITEIETAALADVEIVRAAIESGDRAMYATDNFADRTEFALAREAAERVDERTRRLLSAFQAAVPLLSESNAGREIIDDVAETLDPEWKIEHPVKTPVEDES